MWTPGFWNFDFSVFRNFAILERVQLQFRGEFFNIFNHANFNNPSATLGNPNFGVITSTYPNSSPRTIQMALKASF